MNTVGRKTLLNGLLLVGILLGNWTALAADQPCGSTGEIDPPLRPDEFLWSAYSPASGYERTTLFQVPDSAPIFDRTMVILLHGGGDYFIDDILTSMRKTGWQDIAEAESIVLAYPIAMKDPDDPDASLNWNDGRLGTDIWSMPDNANIDDVGYLEEVIELAQTELGVGASVYIMGISNGGMMTYRLTTESRIENRIRAVSVVAAQIPADRADEPLQQVPALLIGGTEDPLVPFAGGPISIQLEFDDGEPLSDPIVGSEVISFKDTLKAYREVHGCARGPTIIPYPDKIDDGTRVFRLTYCDQDSPLEAFIIAGGGHRWQGRGDNSETSVRECYTTTVGNFDLNYYINVGLSTLDGFDATRASWRFFQNHP